MKILIIAPSVTPTSPRGKRWLQIIKGFLAEGWTVHVVSFDPAVEQLAFHDNCQTYFRPLPLGSPKTTCLSQAISKLWTLVSIGGPAMLWFYRDRTFIRNLAHAQHFDVIIGVGLPLASYALAAAARHSRSVKLIFDIGDPWFALELINFNTLLKPRIILIDRLLETKLYSQADTCVMHVNVLKKYLLDAKLVDSRKCRIIPQISKIASPDSDEPAGGPVSLRNADFEIFYAGNFYRHNRNPQTFFEACKRLGKLRVVLAGNHGEWDAPFIHKVGYLNQNQVFQWYRRADALLLIDSDVDYAVPAKLFELVLLNRPILYVTHGNAATNEILSILKQANARFEMGRQNDVDSIVKAINRLMRQSNEIQEFELLSPSDLGFQTQEEAWIKLIKAL
jgi:glycosyltransferase involved in cell wall biosynthesis